MNAILKFQRQQLLLITYRSGIMAMKQGHNPGSRTVSNNGSGSGLAPSQKILAVQVWFGFT